MTQHETRDLATAEAPRGELLPILDPKAAKDGTACTFYHEGHCTKATEEETA